jgi:hypothetical protein
VAFAIDYGRSAAALLAFVATSILFWFGNNLDPWWPLLRFAPIPVLLFGLRSSWWGAAPTAGLSLLAGSLSRWHYFRVLHDYRRPDQRISDGEVQPGARIYAGGSGAALRQAPHAAAV